MTTIGDAFALSDTVVDCTISRGREMVTMAQPSRRWPVDAMSEPFKDVETARTITMPMAMRYAVRVNITGPNDAPGPMRYDPRTQISAFGGDPAKMTGGQDRGAHTRESSPHDQLLILTAANDLHANALIRELRDRCPDLGVIRINTDCLPTNLDYSFHWTASGDLESQVLTTLDSGITAKNVKVVWYRKPDVPPPHPALTHPIAQKCSVLEYQEFLRSFVGLFPEARWVNDYWQMQRYSTKANQIKIAKQAKLAVPETIITNRLSDVRALASRHAEIIHKTMYFRHFRWRDGGFACFTNLLTQDELSRLTDADVRYAPAIYQQRIQKTRELRVTVVGERVFACEIQSQHDTLDGLDWRVDNFGEQLPHAAVDIPRELEQKLIEVLRLMGLNFGTFDLIQDASGTYYFIEVNPNGQYYRFERKTGLKITSAMVDLIVTLAAAAEA